MPLIRTEKNRLQFVSQALQPGEVLVSEWMAGRSAGALSLAGGNLVLTSQRLLFAPIRTPKVGWIAKLIGGVGGEVGDAIDKSDLLKGLGWSLSDIASVEPLADRPPRLRVLLKSGDAYDFQVLPGRWTPVWSSNTGKRDEAIQQICAAIASAL